MRNRFIPTVSALPVRANPSAIPPTIDPTLFPVDSPVPVGETPPPPVEVAPPTQGPPIPTTDGFLEIPEDVWAPLP